MAPDETEKLGQAAIGDPSGGDASGTKEGKRRRQRRVDLDAHDRMMTSRTADVARDILHDSTPFKEPGSYTVFEARDRAAHTPSIAKEIERQASMTDKPKSPFTDQERYLLDVQQRRDMADIYPDGPEAQWLRERARLAEVNTNGPEARQIQEELRQSKLYADAPEGDKMGNQNEREVNKDVTPEQKTRVDQALGKIELSAQIGGASDVGGKPAPNEPTPLEKSRDIGQDLQRQGVTMDKDK
jgi:hypothetical protein